MSLVGKWNLDTSHSEVGFVARHAGIAKVRGRFEDVASTVVYEEDKGIVTATIKTESFNSGSQDRDNHIKSADFLDVEKFPELNFNGIFDGEELVGEITIKDTTRPITFTTEVSEVVVDPFGAARVGIEARSKISRKDFGLTWNVALEAGGVLVSDQIKLELDLSFTRED